MADAFIVDAVRTAGGRRNGALAGWHPADLSAEVLNALLDRTGIAPDAIEDVIMGCVGQVGEQSWQVGRNAVMASRLPDSCPAVTIDRQCGSSQQSIHFAAQAIMSGTQDVVIAAGVESMSRVPMGSPLSLAAKAGMGIGPWSPRIQGRYGVAEFSQFHGAQSIAAKYGFTREQLDAFALESHRRAAAATQARAFEGEIVPIRLEAGTHTTDEGIRYDASMESIGAVKLLQDGGVLTAANASQVCDGASAVLVVSEGALKAHGLTPMARIHGLTVTAGDPVGDAGGADPRHPACAGTGRHDDRRHRSVRGERGVRPDSAGLGAADRRRSGEDEREWRRHCAGSSARCERRQADGDADPCAAEARSALWSADHVRGRRRCQCHDCRGAVSGTPHLRKTSG